MTHISSKHSLSADELGDETIPSCRYGICEQI